MDRRDLVRASIRHEATPRVPYCIDLCSDAWEQLAAVVESSGPDEFLDNDVFDVPVPWWHWHELDVSWGQPAWPAAPARVLGTGSYEHTREIASRARDDTGKYLLVRVYGVHFEKAYFARGLEGFLADMAATPDEARDFLASIVDRNLAFFDSFLSLPQIDGVLLGSDWGSQRGLIMSPASWHELIGPGEKRMYDRVRDHGKDVWLHSCGHIEALIPTLIDMGVDVLNPVQPEVMDLAHLKAAYGDRLTFWGGISTQRTLPYGSPDDVRAEVRQVRQLMSAGGGYILAPAQSIQSDVPAANVLALLEVAREPSQSSSTL